MSHLLHSALCVPRRKLETVTPNTTIAECIEIMKAKDIGALVVMLEGSLQGIVSERDILRNGNPMNFHKIMVKDILFNAVSVLTEHDTVEKAMQIMIETKRRHILIKENNQYVAIISIGDLLFHLLDDDQRVIQHLEKYIVG